MGIKGYEGKKNKCREQGRKLSKKEWYRGEKKIDYCGKKSRRNGNKTDGKSNVKARAEQKSVLFVEQTREGELSRRLRDLMQRLAPIMGFSIKIVKRAGGAERWAAARGSQKAKEGSHMAKHHELCHPGVEPQFTLRAVGFHPSALSRQTAESVRIAKRGGDLVEQVERAEEEETEANLRELQDRDEKNKRDRAKIWRTLLGREQNSSAKRGSAKELTKRVKRKKLDLIGTDWGMKTTEGGTKTTVEQDKDQN